MWEHNLLGFATPEEASTWATSHPNKVDAIIELRQVAGAASLQAAGERGLCVCVHGLA